MTQQGPLKVGLIGAGNISGAYLNHAETFSSMRIVACSDLNTSLAQERAKEHGIAAMSVDQLLGSDEIDIVLNLTPPQGHAPVNLQALEAGKHVYCEKPFALNLEDAQQVVSLAASKGLRVGCAPDTFLGAGQQGCRTLVDDGAIGQPIAGTAMMLSSGPESWHPNPGFYFLQGGGPVMDMGPYYVTALVNMLGPVAEVRAMAHRSGERTCTSEALMGKKLPVEVDTHVAGTLRFEQGAVVTIVMSFDVISAQHPPIEVFGTEGSLRVPDPNMFGGEIHLAKRGGDGPELLPLKHVYSENYRSIGVADMADAILKGREHRASGSLAMHVLEVLLGLHRAAEQEGPVMIASRVSRPEPLSADLVVGEL
ncbi:Gfo/Idh/MocA family protein [Mucisphaera sp.]|uniref:Gfo/Idh/MocA family protein n=1 Tax=Mucisphaera sp. TaxID=2913024 RepID=UPI003D0CB8C8